MVLLFFKLEPQMLDFLVLKLNLILVLSDQRAKKMAAQQVLQLVQPRAFVLVLRIPDN